MEIFGAELSWESFLVVLVLGGISLLFAKTKWDQLYNRLPPGPWGLPVIGALFQLGSNPYLDFTRMAKKYGNVFSLRLGSRLVVVLNGYEAIRDGLLKKSAIFADRPNLFSFRTFSNGLGISLANYSPKHQFIRKVCQNALHKHLTIDIYEGNLLRESKRLIDLFTQRETVQPKEMLKHASANMSLAVIFGTSYEHADKDLLEAICHNDEVTELMVTNNAVDVFPWLQLFLSKTTLRIREINSLFLRFVQKLYYSGLKTKRNCVVSSILKAVEEQKQKDTDAEEDKIQLTEEEIIYAMRDMFVASLDSSSLTLQWGLAYLVTFPDIQQKLHDELDSILPNNDYVSIEDVDKLPYLLATIFEVLRHSSLTPLSLPHSTTADTTLAGYNIPKGTMVIPNLWSVHRDPSIWKDPDVFNPERFLDGNGHVDDPKLNPSFLPFSLGRRKCLGEEIAYVQLSVLMANILKNVCFSLEGLDPPDLTPVYGLGLSIKPYRVRATKRIPKSRCPQTKNQELRLSNAS